MRRFLVFSLAVIAGCKGGEVRSDRPAAVERQIASARPVAPTTPLTPSASAAPSVATAGSAASAGAAGAPSKDGRQAFGAALALEQLTPLAKVIAEPKKFEEQTVLVEGVVRRACSRKGCWMELGVAQEGASCRVTFKDYGFFVPLDSAGSQAKVEAVVKRSTLKPKDVRHHEREGALFPNKNPDGSADETRLVANGVELWR